MSLFTTEARVRSKFHLSDTAHVPSELIRAAMEDAHEEILRRYAGDPPELPSASLVLGETLLSGAHVLRSLAYADAVYQKHVSIGGSRIEAGDRFRALMAAASSAEKLAWYILEPFLRNLPPQTVCDPTPSREIFGE